MLERRGLTDWIVVFLH
ncbi:unnamed protein product [Linum tenue]|uniref:Uncharacterized protein n=1 Tax=Linum tenue TaxID=586396 RepID=A0AAV0H3E4_9ROSI|nr:unnamed protein product [Linum tenue]CAI0421139.1 unnamed protein product [Linum tenue]